MKSQTHSFEAIYPSRNYGGRHGALLGSRGARFGVENPQQQQPRQCKVGLSHRPKERTLQLARMFELLREPSAFSVRKFADYDQKFERVDREISELKKIIASLHGEGSLPPPGPFEQWIESADAAIFQGKHIAFLQGEGVVASSTSLDSLAAAIADHPRRKELILDFVAGDRF